MKEKVDHEKMCFFITPIGTSKSDEREKMDALKDNILKPILEKHGLILDIAHTIDESGSITDQIFERIVNARLVIVDLTGLNSNVMYELAVRHSFDKPCIVICEETTKLPFDLLSDRTIFFANTIKGAGDLKQEIDKRIEKALESPGDNPVTRAVKKSRLLNNASVESADKMILNEVYSISERLNHIEFKISESNYRTPNKARVISNGLVNDENYLLKKSQIVISKLREDLGREPSIDEISAEIDIPPRVLKRIIEKEF